MKSLQKNIATLLAINAVQIGLACLFGLAMAVAFARGWHFQHAGGWR